METAELQALLGRVTPGPWYADGWYVRTTSSDHYWQIADAAHAGRHVDYCKDNAALIALAPELAAEVLRLRAEADLLRDQIAAREEDVSLILDERNRLRAEQAQTLAANAALVAEVARLREAILKITEWMDPDFAEDKASLEIARAALNPQGADHG